MPEAATFIIVPRIRFRIFKTVVSWSPFGHCINRQIVTAVSASSASISDQLLWLFRNRRPRRHSAKPFSLTNLSSFVRRCTHSLFGGHSPPEPEPEPEPGPNPSPRGWGHPSFPARGSTGALCESESLYGVRSIRHTVASGFLHMMPPCRPRVLPVRGMWAVHRLPSDFQLAPPNGPFLQHTSTLEKGMRMPGAFTRGPTTWKTNPFPKYQFIEGDDDQKERVKMWQKQHSELWSRHINNLVT